jgi:hypothetical protein
MNLQNKRGYIYIKKNGATHPTIGVRSFGSFNGGKVHVVGRKLARTWSLLAEKAVYGMSSISLSHNPEQMVFKENF